MCSCFLKCVTQIPPSERLPGSKPSNVLTGGAESCAKRKLTSPSLLAMPASDRKDGLCNIHHITNGEYANANYFGVRPKALDDLARNGCLEVPGIVVGGINFGSLLSGF